jgi:hypothetical protein
MISTEYKYPLIEVQWDDAVSDVGWESIPDKLEKSIATTVGFLVRETKDHLLIASTYDDNHTNARIQIPKKMIQSRKEITFK